MLESERKARQAHYPPGISRDDRSISVLLARCRTSPYFPSPLPGVTDDLCAQLGHSQGGLFSVAQLHPHRPYSTHAGFAKALGMSVA